MRKIGLYLPLPFGIGTVIALSHSEGTLFSLMHLLNRVHNTLIPASLKFFIISIPMPSFPGLVVSLKFFRVFLIS